MRKGLLWDFQGNGESLLMVFAAPKPPGCAGKAVIARFGFASPTSVAARPDACRDSSEQRRNSTQFVVLELPEGWLPRDCYQPVHVLLLPQKNGRERLV
jgi:hypothetical protein